MFRERTRNSIKNIISPSQELTFTDLKIYYKEKGFDIGDNFEKQLGFFTQDNKYNYLAYLLADENTVSIKVAKYAGDDVATGKNAATGKDAATGDDAATGKDAATGNAAATGKNATTGKDAATGKNAATGKDAATGDDAADNNKIVAAAFAANRKLINEYNYYNEKLNDHSKFIEGIVRQESPKYYQDIAEKMSVLLCAYDDDGKKYPLGLKADE